MGYNENRKVQPLSNENNFYTDGCGNLYEEKYYVNGTYIDLCGLSVEEYMKNVCCGSGNGNSEGSSKTSNEIYVKSFESEDGYIYYQAFSKFEATSNIKISVTSLNGTITELDLFVGKSQTEPEIGETKDFLTITIDIKEDDFYKYTVVDMGSDNEYNIYLKAVLLSNSGNVTEDFEKIVLSNRDSADIVFVIPATDINYNEMESMEEFEKFCVDNQYCLSLCIPKQIYDNKLYSIINYGGADVTDKFIYVKTLSLNDMDYVYLNEKAEDDITPFVPLYGEEIIYEYKLTLNK